MSWADLSDWWRQEVANDPAYETVVTPLLLEILHPEPSSRYLDLGCGEGRVMRALARIGSLAEGIDVSWTLLSGMDQPTVVGKADQLPIREGTYDGVYMVLVLEHVRNHARVFAEAARVTKPGGVMALVCNHPIWTAPRSTPISDPDGEVLWRPGDYFSDGSSEVPAGDQTVTFHHRSMASLLSAAAEAGWSLERMIEQPHHEFENQAGIPRLLACRWSLLP